MEFDQVIKQRRSVRKFSDKQIKEDEIQQLLFAAMAAPVSNKRYQDIHITVIQSQIVLDRIQALVKEIKNVFYGAKTIIVVSSKKQYVPKVTEFNIACIIENMLLEATNLGLGSIFLSYFLTVLEDREELSKLLGISDEYEVQAAVGVGYMPDDNIYNESVIQGRITVNYL